MKVKKVLALVACGALAVSMLAGCGKSQEDTSKTEETSAEKEISAEAEAYEEIMDYGVDMLSEDGSVYITVPDNTWQEAPTEEACVAFSDGASAILINHYNNEGTLPELAAKEDGVAEVYETVITKDDYIITIVGFAATADDVDAVELAVDSVTVDTTKLDSDSHVVVEDQYSINDVNYTKYVATTSLSVRPDGSEDSAPLGTLSLNQQVTVTGEVLKNGEATGWVRIDYNGQAGYVASTYLSSAKVEISKTGKTQVLYDAKNNAITIYEYNDGTWRQAADTATFTKGDNKEWKDSDGNVYYEYQHSQDATRNGNYRTEYTSNGTAVLIYEYSDGSWRDDNNIKYTHNESNDTWAAADKSRTLYDYIPNQNKGNESTYTVSGTQNYLALRNYPAEDASNEIGSLNNGDTFVVTDTSNGAFWYGHPTGSDTYGYVNSKFLTK